MTTSTPPPTISQARNRVLSPRDMRIVVLLQKGAKTKDIAKTLDVTLRRAQQIIQRINTNWDKYQVNAVSASARTRTRRTKTAAKLSK